MRLPIPQKERKGLKLERHVLLRSQKKKNSFSGTVDLSQLPQGLQRLNLANNELSGEAFFSVAFFDRVVVWGTKIIKRHME